MLEIILTRFRIWQLRLDTVRYLSACDDRMLADMGIERANIAAIARRNARADKRLARNAPVHVSAKQHKCSMATDALGLRL